MRGFTYLLTDGTAYKIGMTERTVEERLKELNSSTSQYNEIKIVASCENDECLAFEKELHKQFKKERINKKREWFTLTEEQTLIIQTRFVEQATGEIFAPATPEHEEIIRLAEIRRETKRLEIEEELRRRAELREKLIKKVEEEDWRISPSKPEKNAGIDKYFWYILFYSFMGILYYGLTEGTNGVKITIIIFLAISFLVPSLIELAGESLELFVKSTKKRFIGGD